jgi:hypothetical protein
VSSQWTHLTDVSHRCNDSFFITFRGEGAAQVPPEHWFDDEMLKPPITSGAVAIDSSRKSGNMLAAVVSPGQVAVRRMILKKRV